MQLILAEWEGARKEGRKEMFYLTTHSAYFIYDYMALGIWYRTIQTAREEIRCCHIGLLFPISNKGSFICTYHDLCYTSRGELAGTRNSSLRPQ